MGSNPNVANYFDGNHPLVLLAKSKPEENPNMPELVDLLLEAGSDPLASIPHQADDLSRMDATQTPWFHETPLLCAGCFSSERRIP